MMNSANVPKYHAFLVRIWQEDANEAWRVTLENPHTGQLMGFGDIEAFIEHIRNLSGAANKSV